jgi:hypothetical protein
VPNRDRPAIGLYNPHPPTFLRSLPSLGLRVLDADVTELGPHKYLIFDFGDDCTSEKSSVAHGGGYSSAREESKLRLHVSTSIVEYGF